MFLANVFGQEKGQTSFCYNPNIPKMPLGLNVFYQPKSNFTIFADYKYYKKSNGTERPDAEPGVGIYSPGEWGNSGNANEDDYSYYSSYSYTMRTSWHVGIGWKIFHRNQLSVTPYLGVGTYTYEDFKEYYTTINDVTSGWNVIGYQEISILDHYDLEYFRSYTLGALVRWKALAVGIGYDTAPKGVSLSIGFNMSSNVNNY